MESGTQRTRERALYLRFYRRRTCLVKVDLVVSLNVELNLVRWIKSRQWREMEVAIRTEVGGSQ